MEEKLFSASYTSSRCIRVLTWFLYFLHMLYHGQVLSLRDYPLGVTEAVVVTLGQRGEIRSTDFPSDCCVSQVIVLHTTSANSFIHLMFDDLDLPSGTDFKIYNTDTSDLDEVSHHDMFPHQPDYKFGIWRRPFLSTVEGKNHIVLVLKAPVIRYDSFIHVGFRATYSVTKRDRPFFDLTADLCPALASSLDGSEIRVKPQPMTRYRDKWLDCVWQLKVPAFSSQFPEDTRVYARFETVDIRTKGSVEVRQGLSSEGLEIASGESLTDLNQSEAGFLGTEGFYIRAFLPADDRQNRISFVYGVLVHLSAGNHSDCATGYRCAAPYDTWCLPNKHTCNRVSNCPLGDDERNCQSDGPVVTTTTPRPPTSTVKTLSIYNRPCQSHEYQCSNGRCVLLSNWCDDEEVSGCRTTDRTCPDGRCVSIYDVCPGECPMFEKKCRDGSCISVGYVCGDEPCPVFQEFRCHNNIQCYSRTDNCDGDPVCDDFSDEDDCYLIKDRNNLLYILMLIPVCIVLCAVLIYKLSRRGQHPPHRGRRRRINHPSAAREHAADHLQPSSDSDSPQTSPRRIGYRVVADGNTTNGAIEAPPPYEEVASTPGYVPHQEEDPPPYEETIREEEPQV